jgi:hypothetical protein
MCDNAAVEVLGDRWAPGHSHASVRIEPGVNLLVLPQRIGQSDPALTLRLYCHPFEGTQVQLSEKIDELRARDGT